MGMPVVGTWGGRPEFVLEGGVAGDGTLRDEGHAVHEGRFMLRLPAPVDGQAVPGHSVDDVHHEDVVLTDMNRRPRQLSVGGDDAAGCAVAGGAVRVGAVRDVLRAVFTRTVRSGFFRIRRCSKETLRTNTIEHRTARQWKKRFLDILRTIIRQ